MHYTAWGFGLCLAGRCRCTAADPWALQEEYSRGQRSHNQQQHHSICALDPNLVRRAVPVAPVNRSNTHVHKLMANTSTNSTKTNVKAGCGA